MEFPIETQEAFDAAIGERLERLKRKVRGEYADYDELRGKAEGYDAAQARVAELEGEAQGLRDRMEREALAAKVAEEGSSPRVRGAVVEELACVADAGIIPACAGSSAGPRHTEGRGWDHPRVCGEQGARRERVPSEPGSSPRVRGAD